MLQCSTSLWSADLSNLASEIKRVEPFSERFHIDVADGHYVPTMLFFPDQVKALRQHTQLPFEVHLMTTDPLKWIEPFGEAGADIIIFCLDSTPDPLKVLTAIKSLGKQAGVSLLINEPLELLNRYRELLCVLTIVGTALVAASRLGARCAYAGVLGTDELSALVIAAMQKEKVDMSLVRRRAGVSPIHSVIIVDQTNHTRNVFVELHRNNGADPAWPAKEVLLSTKVLLVDHIGLPGMLRA